MAEAYKFSPENQQLLERLTRPHTMYRKWRSSFLEAGRDYVIDIDHATSPHVIGEDFMFGRLTPHRSGQERIRAGSIDESMLSRMVMAADVAILNLSHLFQEGGVLVTSQTPPTAAILQFGLSEDIQNSLQTQPNGFITLPVEVALQKGVRIPGLQDYNGVSNALIIDPSIRERVKKTGWIPGARRHIKVIDDNHNTIDMSILEDMVRNYIDFSCLGNINPSPQETSWRRLENYQPVIVSRHGVARDIASAFLIDLPGNIKGR